MSLLPRQRDASGEAEFVVSPSEFLPLNCENVEGFVEFIAVNKLTEHVTQLVELLRETQELLQELHLLVTHTQHSPALELYNDEKLGECWDIVTCDNYKFIYLFPNL